ncbi:MAG: hypothetical protein HC878_00185 [Leptolyngbyaceae cyanobacterium SL_5_14]|nr:hypothetical protein [Leptolyngbyaceae cyanobacterium SL_5_14]
MQLLNTGKSYQNPFNNQKFFRGTWIRVVEELTGFGLLQSSIIALFKQKLSQADENADIKLILGDGIRYLEGSNDEKLIIEYIISSDKTLTLPLKNIVTLYYDIQIQIAGRNQSIGSGLLQVIRGVISEFPNTLYDFNFQWNDTETFIGSVGHAIALEKHGQTVILLSWKGLKKRGSMQYGQMVPVLI